MENKLIPNGPAKDLIKPVAMQGGRSREDSYKTLRELPLFGEITHAVDFKHPSIADLLAMPKDKPIQVIGLKWKKNGNCYICGV
jgi:hypothetical protein